MPACAIVFAVTGCGDPQTAPAQIVSMGLTVGDQTVTLQSGVTVTDTLTVSGIESVEVEFFDADGATVVPSGADFALGVAAADPALLAYDPLSPFTGLLEGLASGVTSIEVQVLDADNLATVFGPFVIAVTVP